MAMSKNNEIIYILENLCFLLDSGLSIVGCLDVMSKRNKSLRIIKIKQSIQQGRSFRDAILIAFDSKIPHVMDIFIQIGESCGNLGQMILKALETERQIKKINSSFFGALSYPLFICVIALIMMLLTMIGIVPKLLPMFRDLHVELPFYTRFFMTTSNMIINYGIYILTCICFLVSLFGYFYKKSQEFRIKFENLILKIWGIKSLYIKYQVSIVALCTAEYLRAGYALHNALKMVGDSTRSFAYKHACFSISGNLQKGDELSEVIKIYENLFPEWSHVLDFAVQTGRLADQFERFYLENVLQLEKTNVHIKKWSEPILMLFIGGIIAIFAVSIISPIYSVVQNVRI